MQHSRKGKNNGRKAEDILENGRDLIEKLNQLPDQEYKIYIRDKYDIDKQHARKWIRAVEIFSNRTELIQDLPETMIIDLTDPELSIKDVEYLVIARRNKEIDPDVRSMQQAIKKIKESKSQSRQQEEEPAMPFNFSDFLKGVESERKRIDTKKNTVMRECDAEANEIASQLLKVCKLFSKEIDALQKKAQQEDNLGEAL